ncbi:CapA family protein [Kineosporia rhizophila]|uniref:CapA family protein n=1 Tax=Kineosporia rhizophila TaxID=84633 RepID=UPI001E629539|nr:CapA family protein [Kineosporia rhizophila]
MRRALLLAVPLLLMAGCAAPPNGSVRAATAGSLTLSFAGDIRFAGKPDGAVLEPVAQSLGHADLTLATLSSAPTPEALKLLQRKGIDAVSLANDEVMDYGTEGFGTGVTFGAGRDSAQAYQPWRTEINGQRIAVIGLNQVEEATDADDARPDRPGIASARNQTMALTAVRQARVDSDVVIVMPHWGNRRTSCVSLAQRDFAARLSEAGADVVVGTHAESVQGQAEVNDTFVAFGLGSLDRRGALLRLTFAEGAVVEQQWTPVAGDVETPGPAQYCASLGEPGDEDVFGGE